MQHNHLIRNSLRLMQQIGPNLIKMPKRLPGAFSVANPFPETAAPHVLGRLGSLEARLASKPKDIKRAQRLRYNVFYRDGTAIADAATLLARRDKDSYDRVCDHLLISDHAAQQPLRRKPPIVATCRLLGHDAAVHSGGFYSESEFDIAALVARHSGLRFLELGRACVQASYRSKRTVELLWHGIWSHVRQHRYDVMIGCGSLDGTDPDRLALQLSFLHHFARAPDEWRASAHPSRRVEMNRMPKEAIDARAALRELPPLIKGYLRVGAMVGDGAVVDHQFGTTDVFIVMPVLNISARYIDHFGSEASRHAA